jgi:hypothetical protein
LAGPVVIVVRIILHVELLVGEHCPDGESGLAHVNGPVCPVSI